MIRSNKQLTIREISEDLDISCGSVQNILTTNLNMRQVSAKFVPHVRPSYNVPCHTSLLVRQFLSNKNITVCFHPPYSTDLAPCDFWLFPKVKITIKCKRFESIHDILRGCLHPPYSPYLAPCDFWLFPKVKMTIKYKRFESIHNIEATTTEQLKTFTKKDLQNSFREWQERWDKCVRSEGGVF